LNTLFRYELPMERRNKTAAATGVTVWSGELRFEPDEKKPLAYVEVVDWSGPERRVVETRGVYEYDPHRESFSKITD